MTLDRNGHLFPRGEDGAELAASPTRYCRKFDNARWREILNENMDV